MKERTRRRLRRTSACPAPTYHLNYAQKDEREIVVEGFVCNFILEGSSAGKSIPTLHLSLQEERKCVASLYQISRNHISKWEQRGAMTFSTLSWPKLVIFFFIFFFFSMQNKQLQTSAAAAVKKCWSFHSDSALTHTKTKKRRRRRRRRRRGAEASLHAAVAFEPLGVSCSYKLSTQ